jgi:hypothetical protein
MSQKEKDQNRPLDKPRIKKIIKEIDPIISDDFQIGPKGAYEHRDKSVLTIKRMIKRKQHG